MNNFYWSLDSETQNGKLYFFFILVFSQHKVVKTCVDIQDETLISQLVKEKHYLSDNDQNILLNLETYFTLEIACDILTAYKFKQDVVVADEIPKDNTLAFDSNIKPFATGLVSFNLNKQKVKAICINNNNDVLECISLENTEFSKKLSYFKTTTSNFEIIDTNIHHDCIKVVRQYLSMSCADFSKFLGFTGKNETLNKRVRNWENGTRIPNKSTQRIIQFIKLNGKDNEFVNFLLTT